MVKERSSKKERRVDALALRAEERRDKLRKAAGRSKYPLIRRCLNGETRMSTPHASIRQSITYGGEPPELKHLSRARKRKKIYYIPNGGVAQLGEHLPCKQGVKSSNLSISIRSET